MKKLIILSFLIFYSCKEKNKNLKSESNIYKDSTITILDFKTNKKTNPLNSEEATLILNKHFKAKGYLIENELDFAAYNPEKKEYLGKNAIDYIENIPINKFATIVKYYNCPPFQNGSCVLAHYAIIANTIDEKKILHEDFLPNNFILDSIKIENNQPLIYGYFYECANKLKLQSYRILIK